MDFKTLSSLFLLSFNYPASIVASKETVRRSKFSFPVLQKEFSFKLGDCGVFVTSRKKRLFFCGARYENFAVNQKAGIFVSYVIKEFAHAFSCAFIELWMHLGSLESTQEARVVLGRTSSHSYESFVLSKLLVCIHTSIYAR